MSTYKPQPSAEDPSIPSYLHTKTLKKHSIPCTKETTNQTMVPPQDPEELKNWDWVSYPDLQHGLPQFFQ